MRELKIRQRVQVDLGDIESWQAVSTNREWHEGILLDNDIARGLISVKLVTPKDDKWMVRVSKERVKPV